MNELAKATNGLPIRDMDELARVANMMAQSGLFKSAQDAAQAGVQIMAGMELGIGAFSALSGIHIIEGRPSIGANLMAAAVKRHPRYNYRVLEMTEQKCVVRFFEDGEPCGDSEFTIEQAKKAGAQFKTSKGYDANWTKFPRNMLFARAISNGVKWYCPDVFSTTVYTPEELGADVDGDGEVIEVPVRPADADVAPQEAQEQATAGGAAPEGRTLSDAAAERLRVRLAQNGIARDQQHRFATAMVGRDVRVFTELSHEEATTVFNESARLKAEADAAEDAA